MMFVRRHRVRCQWLLLPLCLLISGCAGTARGIKSSVYQHNAQLEVVDSSRSEADAMVVIRYPAVVDEDAASTYFRAFQRNSIGGEAEVTAQARQSVDRIAQGLIAKSGYYTMSLYRELQQRLPPNSVLLSPHLITLDDQDRLVSEPLLASEQIPSVLTIDFSVYSYPDSRKMMNSEPLTFGDIVTPLFVVHSNRWLQPPTHGLLLSSKALLPSAWRSARELSDQQLDNRLYDRLFEQRRTLDYVSFLQQGQEAPGRIPTRAASGRPDDRASVEVHPLEKIRMEGDIVGRLDQDHRIDPFAEDFVKGAATRVATELNRVDHDRATFFSRQIALSRFDPSLGEAFLSRSRSESIRARLQMAEALIEAERKFVAAQSRSLYQGVYEGVYGQQVRDMLAAEYRLLEDRRELARAQNISTALAVLAMAGAVYAGNNVDAGNYGTTRAIQNVLMMSSMWAVNTAMSKNAESKTVGENFLLQMAPAINRQVAVQLEWLESREEITARDFDEFRAKTLALYQRSVRATDHVFDPHCEFVHPLSRERGRWFGLCQGGLAYSSGYGLIIDASGRVVEYIGDTRKGLAEGNGAMILRNSGTRGVVYYEGSFKSGLPHGIVLVENPGERPKVRQFNAGQDAGAADADQLKRLLF